MVENKGYLTINISSHNGAKILLRSAGGVTDWAAAIKVRRELDLYTHLTEKAELLTMKENVVVQGFKMLGKNTQ